MSFSHLRLDVIGGKSNTKFLYTYLIHQSYALTTTTTTTDTKQTNNETVGSSVRWVDIAHRGIELH